jgi:hypothetical protein
MRQVTALQLRKDLKAYTEEVRKTGKPTALVIHGEKVIAIVPIEWAEVLDQVAQFDKCDANPEAIKTDMKQVFERAFAEASARPLLSLAEIFRKIAEDATTVHQFHSLQKSLE